MALRPRLSPGVPLSRRGTTLRGGTSGVKTDLAHLGEVGTKIGAIAYADVGRACLDSRTMKEASKPGVPDLPRCRGCPDHAWSCTSRWKVTGEGI